MSEIAEAVAGTVGDLFGDTTEEPVETQETVQETEVAVELPDWNAATRDLFTEDEEDEPLFIDEVEPEPTEDLEVSEYDDENTARLKRQLAAERKRTEHFQKQHLKSSRRTWEADVAKQPWAEFAGDLSGIKADSHRDFVRKAKTQAKNNYEVLKPHIAKLEAARDQLRAQVTQEVQAEVKDAWGRPTIGGPRVPDTADQRLGDKTTKLGENLDEARRGRNLFKATKAMIDGGLI